MTRVQRDGCARMERDGRWSPPARTHVIAPRIDLSQSGEMLARGTPKDYRSPQPLTPPLIAYSTSTPAAGYLNGTN